MTDFNELPLAEQLKALEPGDELHLRGGGWLPFRTMTGATYPINANGQSWSPNGSFYAETECDLMDIIRVHRPTERKVPEVDTVKRLRHLALNTEYDTKTMIAVLADILADHFEKETP